MTRRKSHKCLLPVAGCDNDLDQTLLDGFLTNAQSQAVLEHYRELAAVTADNISQMKVVIEKLEKRATSESAGKGQKEVLPACLSIDYMKNLVPLGPAEPGMRLLKSVTVSTKSADSEEFVSEAGSKKWKLPVDTDHDSGETKYGILNMGWTTHVPMATVDAHRRDNELSHILTGTEARVSHQPERHRDSHERSRYVLGHFHHVIRVPETL
ncbi:hypothetical protein NP493_559g01053 [Ridgeia piscesae]|uniref:Uncharacterized protein n=1 Tax=Ridgeia piscesae TaxID=27915 RepID=A0AAD9KVL5_RIDPI|nr:hypothetical protein NP493_559g01053 [Ridgeia piscesae]